MRQIQLNSPEFNRVTKNLELENLSLSPVLQKKAVDIVNSRTQISPKMRQEALNDGKVQ